MMLFEQFVTFVVIVFALLKHRIQLAAARAGTAVPRTTGTRVRQRIAVLQLLLVGDRVVAVQVGRRARRKHHVAAL